MSLKYRFRQIKKFPDWVYAPIAWLLYLMKAFMRKRIVDPNHLLGTWDKPTVVVTWHNRLLFFPIMFPKRERSNTMAVISASRDGQYIADLAKYLGIGSIRGSSSRRGVNALLGAFNAVQDGKFVVFTPDGPRGPRYKMSQGPVFLASQTGVPVLPISVNYSRFWALKSWDGFRIPKPFSTVTLVIGTPIYIPSELSPENLEIQRKLVETALNEISED